MCWHDICISGQLGDDLTPQRIRSCGRASHLRCLPAESRAQPMRRERQSKKEGIPVSKGSRRTMAKVKLNPVLEAIHGKVRPTWCSRNTTMSTSSLGYKIGQGSVRRSTRWRSRINFAWQWGTAKPKTTHTPRRCTRTLLFSREPQPSRSNVGDFLDGLVSGRVDMSACTGRIGKIIRVRVTDDMEDQRCECRDPRSRWSCSGTRCRHLESRFGDLGLRPRRRP